MSRARTIARETRNLIVKRGAERQHARRMLLWEAAGVITSTVAVRDEDLEYVVNTGDQVISRELFGGLSPEFRVATMRSQLQAVTEILGGDVVAGKVFVDVGANIGTTTVPAVAVFGASRAISIEPSPVNRRLLQANIALNDVQDKVTVVAAAVTSSPQDLVLELSDDNFGDHRIRTSSDAGAFAEEARATVTVPGRRLDEILESANVAVADIGLLWIDVQGHEAHVLESAGTFLGPTPLLMEYGPYWLDRAGGLADLHALIAGAFSTVVDMRTGERLPASSVGVLEGRYSIESRKYTDLLLLPHPL